MEYAVKTDRLVKRYGSQTAVNGVDMHIRKGDIYGFIGKNGAGKTTLMKMLCGLTQPSSGSYTIFGCENPEQARKRIGSLIENPALFPKMTVKENLTYYAMLKNASDAKLTELLDLAGLTGAAVNRKAENLSLGMKQRLSIAVALLNDPELLILDEPINGLDPEGIVEIRQLLMKLNRERGITILISSHILGELEKMATRYGVIRDGILVREFDAEELKQTSTGKVVIDIKDYSRAKRILEENGIEIESICEEKENIESYFIGLVG